MAAELPKELRLLDDPQGPIRPLFLFLRAFCVPSSVVVPFRA